MPFNDLPLFTLYFESNKSKKKTKGKKTPIFSIDITDDIELPCYKKGDTISCKFPKKTDSDKKKGIEMDSCPESEKFDLNGAGKVKMKVKKKDGVCYLEGLSIKLPPELSAAETEDELEELFEKIEF